MLCCCVLCVGDFDVPSSREEIDRDSVWNQWLRAEIHHVFVNALEVFKVCSCHKEYASEFVIKLPVIN